MMSLLLTDGGKGVEEAEEEVRGVGIAVRAKGEELTAEGL